MNIPLILRTVRHLKIIQIFYQLKYRITKPAYKVCTAPDGPYGRLQTQPVSRYSSCSGTLFTFLNISRSFSGWNFTENGLLWAYNQNYFDWINQEKYSKEEACLWIDRFITDELDCPTCSNISLDPYPIALRSINWVKFFCRHPECATKVRLNALYSQVMLLENKLEYHLLGNHLLEDIYALYIVSAYFNDGRLMKKAKRLLMSQLKEQTLSDGAHYEQSPMYHCILLDRLLDCINIAPSEELMIYARMQLGWLKAICYKDGTYPLFNDAAVGIAPLPQDIIDYACRLGIDSEESVLGESGYRKLSSARMEVFADVGNITARYQPGHTHADVLTYELRVNGKPFIVDTGISTYNKDEQRQYERSTIAHNCVVIDGRDSSEVWGGFRVGHRAKASISHETDLQIQASHDGYGAHYQRREFEISDGTFSITDDVSGEAVGYIHFAHGVMLNSWSNEHMETDEVRMNLSNVKKIEIEEVEISSEYNKRQKALSAKLYFNQNMKLKFIAK